MSTQATSASNYQTKNMIFSKPIFKNKPVQHGRVKISTRYPDGKVGDLILITPLVNSSGINENRQTKGDPKSPLNSYSLSLYLWNNDGPTKEQKEWTDTFNNVVMEAKKWLLGNKREVKKPTLKEMHLENFNPLYWSKLKDENNEAITDEKGDFVLDKDRGPALYPKLLLQRWVNGNMVPVADAKIRTDFYDENGTTIHSSKLLKQRCQVCAAVKIESIFLGGGNKVSLQVKITEAQVTILESTSRRLIPLRKTNRLVVSSSNPMLENKSAPETNEDTEDGEWSEGSLDGDDEPESPRKPVTRTTTKTLPKSKLKKRNTKTVSGAKKKST